MMPSGSWFCSIAAATVLLTPIPKHPMIIGRSLPSASRNRAFIASEYFTPSLNT